jgi:HEAT repeat protein
MTASLLLTDAQVQKFIAHGYLCLKTQLPQSFHRHIYDRFDALIGNDEGNNPGNNLLPMVPELDAVFADPVVTGALTSILGSGYAMHPHRALHNNLPGSDAQNLHKDSYWGFRSRMRNHHPRWVMIMYVPQATPLEQGPTGVVPGSQYQTRRPSSNLMPEVPGSLEEGGFLLIHYDVWHRKFKNHTTRNRFMMKFEFARMAEPSGPTWDYRDSSWRLSDRPSVDMSAVWRRQWRWLRNADEAVEDAGPAPDLVAMREALSHSDPHVRLDAINTLASRPRAAAVLSSELASLLDDDCDPVSISSAYALAVAGSEAVGKLVVAVRRNDGPHVRERDSYEVPDDYIVNEERIARNATYGLTEIGLPAVPACLALLQDGDARARKLAAFALGEIAGTDDRVTEALSVATRDPEPTVRVNAAEALGYKPGMPASVAALTELMRDTAPDVRFSAAMALAQQGPRADSAVAALQTALKDENRYVPGYAVEALQRIATPEAMQSLVAFLKTARWCPHTSPKSIF